MTLAKLKVAIALHEKLVRRCLNKKLQDGSKPTLTADIRITALIALCPKALKEHLSLSHACLDTYEEHKHEILGYLEAKRVNESDPGGAKQMD